MKKKKPLIEIILSPEIVIGVQLLFSSFLIFIVKKRGLLTYEPFIYLVAYSLLIIVGFYIVLKLKSTKTLSKTVIKLISILISIIMAIIIICILNEIQLSEILKMIGI